MVDGEEEGPVLTVLNVLRLYRMSIGKVNEEKNYAFLCIYEYDRIKTK